MREENIRQIKDGSKFDHMIKPASGARVVLHSKGNTQKTIASMYDMVEKYHTDVVDLAKHLHDSSSLLKTLKNNYDFVKDYIAYEEDKPGEEQLRRPSRLWADKRGDCDCMAIWHGAIMKCQGIHYNFRTVAVAPNTVEHHVYPVVKTAKKEITIDNVMPCFNCEDRLVLNKKEDFKNKNMEIVGLMGIYSEEVRTGNKNLDNFINFEGVSGLSGDVFQNEEQSLKAYYQAELEMVKSNPDLYKSLGYDPNKYAKDLVYLLKYWDTKQRDAAIQYLIDNTGAELSGVGLGRWKLKWCGVSCQRKKLKDALSKIKKKAKKVIGKAVHIVKKHNPISVAIRAAIIAILRSNKYNVSHNLKWAFANSKQKKAHPILAANARKGYAKLKRLYVTKGGGDERSLKKAIIKGGGKLPKSINIGRNNSQSQRRYSSRQMQGLGSPISPAEIMEAIENEDSLDGLGELGVIPAAVLALIDPIIRFIVGLFGKKKGQDVRPGEIDKKSPKYDPRIDPSSSSYDKSLDPSQTLDSEVNSYPDNGVADDYSDGESKDSIISRIGLNTTAKKALAGSLSVVLVGGIVYYFVNANNNKDKKAKSLDGVGDLEFIDLS